MNREIIETSDGSHSIYLKEMDEHYHSKHGAIAESQHIFIQNGLIEKARMKNSLSIFEVGMGTGLNVLTTFLAAEKAGLEIDYHTIEAYPVDWEEAQHLNYSEQLGMTDQLLKEIHNADWGEETKLSDNFKLIKYNEDVLNFKHGSRYDLIYFDAFAPEKQEEMWSEAVFKNLFDFLTRNGVLVTYCVKGEIRRRLKGIGFEVEKLAGPVGGKREMCRAIKP